MKHKILILDDIAQYVQSLKKVLAREYTVETAYSLREAKAKADADIDLYLVDVRLDESQPDNEEGVHFLEWVRRRHGNKPVVMMSAYREYETRKEELLTKGASAFLRKPITIEHLRVVISQSLSECDDTIT